MDKKRTIAGILALIWMCVIFSFSAQPSEESSEVSGGLSYQIISSAGSFFHLDLDEEELHRIAAKIEKPVRKAAHMTEYAILVILLYVWLGKWQFPVMKRGFLALLTSILYAASDETHQRFVPGRAGKFSDVLIDSAGAVLGLFIFIGVKKCISFLSNRRKYKAKKSS